MNRLAIHESSAPDLSPTELVDIRQADRLRLGRLKVAHSPGADRWWRKGAGSAELRTMVEHLLISRVSVLDIGRVELGDDTETSYRAVLDLAERLGARYVTASGMPTSQRPDAGRRATGDTWGRLVADCENYQLIPLLVAVPGTTVSTTDQALDIARAVGGAVVLTVSTGRSAFEIESQVLEAGNRLGYLRLLAGDLDAIGEDGAAGLLATVPVHVPIAVGSVTESEPGDLMSRAHRWSGLIDRMLEHPLARASRLRGAGGSGGGVGAAGVGAAGGPS